MTSTTTATTYSSYLTPTYSSYLNAPAAASRKRVRQTPAYKSAPPKFRKLNSGLTQRMQSEAEKRVQEANDRWAITESAPVSSFKTSHAVKFNTTTYTIGNGVNKFTLHTQPIFISSPTGILVTYLDV